MRSGLNSALGLYHRLCVEEAQSASVNFLVNDARKSASKGNYDRALVQLQRVKNIQGQLSTEITEDVKRRAARGCIAEGKEHITRYDPPDINGSLSLLRKAVELDPTLPFNPETEARQLATLRFVKRARDLVDPHTSISPREEEFLRKAFDFNPDFRSQPEFVALNTRIEENRQLERVLQEGNKSIESGKIKEALTSYTELEARLPSVKIPAGDWNKLCWFGSLHGAAHEVKFACDKAVEMEQSQPGYRDSRGLARALTGDRRGAREDFQYFIEHSQASEETKRRQEWLALLQSRKEFTLTDQVRKLLLQQ